MNRRGGSPGGTSRLWPRHGHRRPGAPLGRAEAERLLAGQATGADHGRLAELLAAVTGPVPSQEASAYHAARDAFVRADAGFTVAGGRHTSRGPRALPVAKVATVKIVGGALLVSLTGAAAAAETGVLPAPVQRVAHTWFGDLGVPAPAPEDHKDDGAGRTVPRPGVPTPTGVAPGGGTTPARIPGASGTGRGAVDPAVADLCQALTQGGADGHGRALDATERRTLALAAGGEQKIATYCGELTPMSDTSSPASSASAATTTPTEPVRTHPAPPTDSSHTPAGVGSSSSGHGHTQTPTPPQPTH